jgi:ketopantoate hydroxymethyltransferase
LLRYCIGKNSGKPGQSCFEKSQHSYNRIGAGKHCDGQVLVMHDMLGINTEFKPRFLRQYLNLNEVITGAVQHYIKDVRSNDFPNESEQY